MYTFKQSITDLAVESISLLIISSIEQSQCSTLYKVSAPHIKKNMGSSNMDLTKNIQLNRGNLWYKSIF